MEPLIENGAGLGCYLRSLFQQAVLRPGAPVNGPSPSDLRVIREKDGRFKALLPPFVFQGLVFNAAPASSSREWTAPLSFDAEWAALLTQAPRWSVFYEIGKRSDRGVVSSALTASSYFVRAWMDLAWHWLRLFAARHSQPSVVRLGTVSFKTRDPDFKNLESFERGPAGWDKTKRNDRSPRVAVAFLDLEGLNRPYLDFWSAYGRPGAAGALLSSAEDLAGAYRKLSGDSSGIAEVRALSQGVRSSSRLDLEASAYWVAEMRRSALAFILRAARGAEENLKKDVVFADPRGGLIFAAVREPDRAASLGDLGFAVQKGSPNLALFVSGGGENPEDLKETFAAAEAVVSGKRSGPYPAWPSEGSFFHLFGAPAGPFADPLITARVTYSAQKAEQGGRVFIPSGEALDEAALGASAAVLLTAGSSPAFAAAARRLRVPAFILSGRNRVLPEDGAVTINLQDGLLTLWPAARAQERLDASHAVRAFAGLKSEKAFLNWWSGHDTAYLAWAVMDNIAWRAKALGISRASARAVAAVVEKSLPRERRKKIPGLFKAARKASRRRRLQTAAGPAAGK